MFLGKSGLAVGYNGVGIIVAQAPTGQGLFTPLSSASAAP